MCSSEVVRGIKKGKTLKKKKKPKGEALLLQVSYRECGMNTKYKLVSGY